jgi:hypothetical protein
MRYYNELPNLFKDRVYRIERNMDKIINSYKSIVREIIFRFLIFTIGSIFLVLLVMSFIANKNFANLHIIGGHNIIWFLGVSGTMLIILNKCLSSSEKMTRMEKLKAFEKLREDLITINPKIIKIDDREFLVGLIRDIYELRLITILYEIWYLLASPYYLLKWKKEIIINCNQILELVENHHSLGNVCKYSIFTNVENMENNQHMLLSLKEFCNNHKWELPIILQTNDMVMSNILVQNNNLD